MSEAARTEEWVPQLIAAVRKLDSPKLLALARILRERRAPPGAAIVRGELAASTGEATRLARALDATLAGRGAAGIGEAITALTTLAHVRELEQQDSDKVQIVCTAPVTHGVAVRATFAAAVQMVGEALEDILVIGFVFTGGARKLVQEVAKACQERNVRVTIVGNRMSDVMPALRAAWPRRVRPPAVFSREGDPGDISALHAKVLVCDGRCARHRSAR